MNVININLGSFNTSKELLKHYAQDKKANIICISETFEHRNNLHLPGWKFYSKPRDEVKPNINPHGGVAIFVKKDTKPKPFTPSDLPDIETICSNCLRIHS